MKKGCDDVDKNDFRYEDVVIPNISLSTLFETAVQAYSQNIALTFYGRTYRYDELYQQVLSVANGLAEDGVKQGDRVALMLPNMPAYPISYFAIMYLGASVVQINPMYRPNELLYILQDANVSTIILHESLQPVFSEIREGSQVKRVYTTSFDKPSSFDRLLKSTPIQQKSAFVQPKEDVAVIQYTGGTTGRSKGAMLTHFNLVANAYQSSVTMNTDVEEEIVLTAIPLFHVYGMTSAMTTSFLRGSTILLLSKFDVAEMAKVIETERPTSFPGVPTMYMALIQYAKKYGSDFSSIQRCTSGSAPLPVEMIYKWKALTGADVLEGYGLSESSPVTHRNPFKGVQKPGSIGITVSNTEAKIVDMETGQRERKNGEVGELIIKGPQVMKGYLGMEVETAQTLRNDWLYTGDLAKQDEDGYFYIVGRKKELIIASGYNVYPIEVEKVLYQLHDVVEAAVVGIPDAYRGETVKAFIVKKEGSLLSESEVLNHCRLYLSPYKVPKFIQFEGAFPKTAVGKILKRKLIEEVNP